MNKKTGFTIIELLVTIAVLGILSSIAAVVYSGVTAKARDNQRIRDLQTIQQALELYRGNVHSYPQNINDLSIYLSPIPTDKTSGRLYYYSPSIDGLSFILCAKKESTDTSYDLIPCKALPSGSCGSTCDIGISSQ